MNKNLQLCVILQHLASEYIGLIFIHNLITVNQYHLLYYLLMLIHDDTKLCE